ncbi:MAG: TMAO reductase system periplasmic protein TorT [Sulfuritalea sp.]|nr:TMAO reductase system periplasmic protein TorT [Sulfuritalea sp.]
MRTLAVGVFLAIFSTLTSADWSPLKVDVWDPPFNNERKHKAESYTALDKAGKKWNLCVAIPHLKDAYWLAVNYGLVEHARQLGVVLTIHAAGGYDKLDKQREQVAKCLSDNVDALILGAIKSDGLNDLIDKFAARGKPVIDLINGINSPKLTARTAADFFEMGKAAGDYAVKNISAGKPMKAAWLPGPKGAGWAEAGDQGFQQALKGKSLKIADTAWGDTGLAAQAKLVRQMLDAHPDLDIIAGTAVSAEAAVQELRRRKLSDRVKVLSYYFAPAVHRGIQRGGIAAAPSDVPGLQARLSVDVAVRALEKKPFPHHLSAQIQLIDGGNVRKVDLSGSLAPEGFRAIFSINR